MKNEYASPKIMVEVLEKADDVLMASGEVFLKKERENAYRDFISFVFSAEW